jgi:hypothetical protein
MPCKITKKIEIKKCSKCKKHSSGVKDEKESFNWVKKWGFQNVSYLFDYLDPILRNEIIAEFESIYQNVFNPA